MSRKTNFDLSFLIFVVSATLLFGGTTFGIGLYSAHKKNILYQAIKSTYSVAKSAIKNPQSEFFERDSKNFVQPARKAGNGVTVNLVNDDGHLVFMAEFFDNANALRLVRRDGSIVAAWPVSYSKHFPSPSFLGDSAPVSDFNVDIHGALILPDGSVVFNYEYFGMVKLSHCGEILWTVSHPTHHSIIQAQGGGFFVPGRDTAPSGSPKVSHLPYNDKNKELDIRDDLILRISDEGQILSRASLSRIMFENGLGPLMTATGESFSRERTSEFEVVHLNKIDELRAEYASAFPMFQAGDLLLSIRERNMLIVIDPDKRQVKWHQIGPWLRQHSPEFTNDGSITLFNNNSYRISLGPYDRADLTVAMSSNIMRVDPRSGKAERVYGERPGQEFLSVIRGKQHATEDGGILITEFEGGRIFQINQDGKIVWEYMNRFDDERMAEVTSARVYPKNYFTVASWSCPPLDT